MTRLAREGWFGIDGTTVTFMTSADAGKARDMLQILRISEEVQTNEKEEQTHSSPCPPQEGEKVTGIPMLENMISG